MPTTTEIFFTIVDGGYPNTINGSTAAITDDSDEFFIDLGKSAGYATMEVSEPHFNSTLVNKTITSLTIVMRNAYGPTNGSIVDAQLWHPTDDEYTGNLHFETPATNNGDLEVIPDTFPLWSKSWTPDDVFNTKILLNNPQEPSGGIALRSTFIYLMVGYEPIPGRVNLSQGKVILKGGKIEL
jgi:hypothetical protein